MLRWQHCAWRCNVWPQALICTCAYGRQPKCAAVCYQTDFCPKDLHDEIDFSKGFDMVPVRNSEGHHFLVFHKKLEDLGEVKE
jgi:hypothetical protein